MAWTDRELLDAGLDDVRRSPRDDGELRMIVRRPGVGERELLDVGELDLREGLVGDSWIRRDSSRMPEGGPHPDMQLNVMNARAVALLADTPEEQALAGDQLYVDLDLSKDGLPPWTQLAIGEAVIQVTDQPHTGCAKFRERFGPDAVRWLNSPDGRALNLRGINAKVVVPGRVRVGDRVRRVE